MSVIQFRKRKLKELQNRPGNIGDLAKSLHNYLRLKKIRIRKSNLSAVLEICYTASMKTEEGSSVPFTVVFVDPKDGDPFAPPNIRMHRWTITKLRQRVPLTVRNIIKLASGVNPAFSAVAIYSNRNGTPFIWGIVDQEVIHKRAINRDRDGSFDRPGLFQIEVDGVGILSIFDENVLIASIRQNHLVFQYYDVLNDGPIREKLNPYIDRIYEEVVNSIEVSVDSGRYYRAERLWIGALARLLLQIRRMKHGGAILIVNSDSERHLDIKYAMRFDRLHQILVERMRREIMRNDSRNKIDQEYLDKQSDTIPSKLYLNEVVSRYRLDDAIEAEVGALNLISSMSKVDGAIVLSNGLKTIGFGAEITQKQDPKFVYVANTTNPNSKNLKKFDFLHLGTRHRSMMRYCNSHPKAVGFVVSQDGEVRAVTKLKEKLIIWENLQIEEIITGFYRVDD